jgi:hypothetical protein
MAYAHKRGAAVKACLEATRWSVVLLSLKLPWLTENTSHNTTGLRWSRNGFEFRTVEAT